MRRARGGRAWLCVAAILLLFAFLAGFLAARDAAGATPPGDELLELELSAPAAQPVDLVQPATFTFPCLPAGLAAASLQAEGFALAAAGVDPRDGGPLAILELWRDRGGAWVLVYHARLEGPPLRCALGAGPAWRDREGE